MEKLNKIFGKGSKFPQSIVTPMSKDELIEKLQKELKRLMMLKAGEIAKERKVLILRGEAERAKKLDTLTFNLQAEIKKLEEKIRDLRVELYTLQKNEIKFNFCPQCGLKLREIDDDRDFA